MQQWKLKVKVKFTYRQIYGYIKDGKYPEILEKCELVGKGPSFFKVHAGDTVYYTGGMFYVNVRLAIDPSLAKISGANLRLAASTSRCYRKFDRSEILSLR